MNSSRVLQHGIQIMVGKKKPVAKPTKKKVAKPAKSQTSAPVKKAKAPKVSKATKKKSTKSKKTESVDGILMKYKKERTTKETLLANLKKKIADLELKTKAYQKEIVKLRDTETKTEITISELDSRRDSEVSKLLAKLGVQVSQDNAPEVESHPLFDLANESKSEKQSQGSEPHDDGTDDDSDKSDDKKD